MLDTIEKIDIRLSELREEYKTAGVEKRKFIIAGANLLKNHRQWLIQTKEKI